MFKVVNLTGGDFSAGGVNLVAGQTQIVTEIPAELERARVYGKVTIDPSLVPAYTVVAANGTAVTTVSGVATIPAVTDFPTAANAVATLVESVNALTVQVASTKSTVARLDGVI